MSEHHTAYYPVTVRHGGECLHMAGFREKANISMQDKIYVYLLLLHVKTRYMTIHLFITPQNFRNTFRIFDSSIPYMTGFKSG